MTTRTNIPRLIRTQLINLGYDSPYISAITSDIYHIFPDGDINDDDSKHAVIIRTRNHDVVEYECRVSDTWNNIVASDSFSYWRNESFSYADLESGALIDFAEEVWASQFENEP